MDAVASFLLSSDDLNHKLKTLWRKGFAKMVASFGCSLSNRQEVTHSKGCAGPKYVWQLQFRSANRGKPTLSRVSRVWRGNIGSCCFSIYTNFWRIEGDNQLNHLERRASALALRNTAGAGPALMKGGHGQSSGPMAATPTGAAAAGASPGELAVGRLRGVQHAGLPAPRLVLLRLRLSRQLLEPWDRVLGGLVALLFLVPLVCFETACQKGYLRTHDTLT